MSKRLKKIVMELIVMSMTLVFVFPLAMVIVNSLKSEREAGLFTIHLPEQIMLSNYVTVFHEGNIIKSFINGFSLATITCVLTVILSSMAAFYIARSKTKLATFAYYYFVAGMIIPVALIPLFFIVLKMGMMNTYSILVLVFLGGSFPFNVFIYTGFIKAIPNDLDEAAIIDGAGKLRVFFQIIFPLVKSATISVGILTFMGVWNDITTQLYLTRPDKWTMPMTVYKFTGMFGNQWNLVFADLILTSIPTIIIYIIAQKYMVSGLTAGAVKG